MSSWTDWQNHVQQDRERERTREAERDLRIAHAVVKRLLDAKPISPELMRDIMLYASEPHTYRGTVDHALSLDAMT